VTQEYRVEGPTMLMMTTTAIDIDEELMNRCLVLAVDENREQTQAIHRLQREKRTLSGLIRGHEKQAILDLHRNAQRLIRPLAVVNPWADKLTFLDDRTRTRRDHEKYLTLIDTIALLHQHQRPIRTTSVGGRAIEYIEATLADIAIANDLAHEVLGRSIDELPPQTRRMLAAIVAHVAAEARAKMIRPADVRFSRADIRRRTGLGDTQCRLHLDRLASLEYLLVHRGRRGQSFDYELLYDGAIDDSAPRLAGLIDVDALRSADTTSASRGADSGLAGSSRGHGGDRAAPSRVASTPAKPGVARDSEETPPQSEKTHSIRANGAAGSYAQDTAVSPLAASA
jgi:DNA primase